MMLVLPLASILVNIGIAHINISVPLAGKWFLFWGVGIRLFTAGIRQALKPAFTAETIFHITDKQSHIIVKELGYANICMGAIGIIALFLPAWCMAAAFAGGLYMGIAGVFHLVKKPVSLNEWVAMISDLFIAIIMCIYILTTLA